MISNSLYRTFTIQKNIRYLVATSLFLLLSIALQCNCIKLFLLPIFQFFENNDLNQTQINIYFLKKSMYLFYIALIFGFITIWYSFRDFFCSLYNSYKTYCDKNNYNIILIGSIIALGIFFRFYISKFGYNYDFESWKIVGKIASEGSNVYEETHRYNYGPLFSLILKALYTISQGNFQYYRFGIISVLTIFDIGIALYIVKNYGLHCMMLFFINPISIIITGYHNQFDTIAILFGIYSIYFGYKFLQNNHNPSLWYGILSLLFLSLSFVSKHILLFFPIWIIFHSNISYRIKILFFTVPLSIFILSFIPYISGNYEAIIEHVFKYKSHNNYPLLLHRFIHIYTNYISDYYRIIFLIVLIAIGYVNRQRNVIDLFCIYLLSIVCFSSAITNQYLVIPLFALSIIQSKLKYVYFIIVSVFLLLHKDGLGLFTRLKIENQNCNMFIEIFVQNSYTLAVVTLFAIIISYKKIMHKI